MVIRKLPKKSKYRLYSHTGKILGTFLSRKKAVKREKQIQFFKQRG
jgi:hypothetical protein